MEKKRGFVKFSEFNKELIRLYTLNPNLEMIELVKKIINWAEKKQNEKI